MAVKHLPPPKPKTVVAAGADVAPFLYFDGATALGQRDGIVQLELAANHHVAMSDGETKVRLVTVAHMRCSISTVRQLADIFDRFLDGIDRPQDAAPAAK